MRKSKISSAHGHLGGVKEEVGIVPPAAAAFDAASRPEDDPILRQTLSPEELASISQYRTLANSKRSRQYSHERQAENDKKREMVAENLRRKANIVKSASPTVRKRKGEAFRLGKTAPLSEQEEAELTGNVLPEQKLEETPAEKPKAKRKTRAKRKTKTAKKVAPEPVPVEAENIPAPEEGGQPFFPNALGTNLVPIEPKEGSRRGRRPKK
jgi:hypothetical protein